MRELAEEQYELDGYLFGEDTPIRVMTQGVDYGTSDVDAQDAPRATAGGYLMGRDFTRPAAWTLTLQVRHGYDVWQTIGELAGAWRAAGDGKAPGELAVLRWRRAGTTYRVYGRARKFDVPPWVTKNDQLQHAIVTFQPALPERCVEVIDGTGPRSFTVPLVQSAAGSGVTWPAAWPFEWSGGAAGQGHGVVTVGGTIPAAFTVTINGPVTGSLKSPRVSGPGWEIASSVPVLFGQRMVIDTRAQSITVDGRPVPGSLSSKSRLTARLQTGQQQLSFSGVDPSNTSSATFEWFDTVPA